MRPSIPNHFPQSALHKIQALNISNESMRINFLTNSGYLLVVGQVSNQKNMNAIDAQLKTLKEAKGIYNQLRVGKPINFAQQSRDSWITAQIKAQFTSNDAIDPFKIKVVTENKEVYLVGRISNKMATAATQIARNVQGVKHVNRAFQLIE